MSRTRPTMTAPTPLDVSALLRHRDFLRALTRALVADEHLADDAVQQTWLAALQTPPRSAAASRAWLARVAANFARRIARREHEQTERERRAPRSEATDEQAAVDFDLLERLAAALRALPAPLRSTIHLRYFEDLAPRQIAAREGVPLDTVKTRLRRGLALLRADLDAKRGSRGAWCVGLAALVEPSRPAAGPAALALVKGLLAMKLVGITSAAAAALFLLVLGIRALHAPDPAPAGPTAVAAAPEAPQLAEATSTPARESESAEPRTALAPPPPAGAAAEPLPNDVALGRVGRLRVVDTHDEPVPGARVAEPGRPARLTGADGHVEMPLPAGSGSARLALDADGFLATHADVSFGADGDVVDLGEHLLVRGGMIRGVVVDEQGSVVAGAEVAATAVDGVSWSPIPGVVGARGPRARTGALGTFELVGVRPGEKRVQAGAPGFTTAASDVIAVAAGERSDGVRLVLRRVEREDEIAGRVLLPADRTAGALTVWTVHRSAEGTRCRTAPVADDGTFRVPLEARVPHDVWAQETPTGWDSARQVFSGERALAGWRPVVERDVAPGTTGLVLGFERARGIDVRVSDERGVPLDAVELGVIAFAGTDLGQQEPWVRSVAPPVRIDVPASAFRVLVSAEGHDEVALGPFEPGSAPPALDVTLRRLPPATGRVTADGRPVAGAKVELFGLASARHRVTRGGFRLRTEPVASAVATTDAEGAYRLTARRAGTYVVRAEAAGRAAAEIGPLELDPRSGASALDLTLTPGGAIEGRVLAPAGAEPTGLAIGASRGDVHGRTVVVGPDGAFRFERLTPGPWRVEIVRDVDAPVVRSSTGASDAWTSNCAVVEGRTTTFDLDLRGAGSTRVRGRWSVDGLDDATWTAFLRRGTLADPGPSRGVDRVPVAADGTFELVAPEPGAYLLGIEHDDFPGAGVIAMRELDLDGGELDWSETLRVGAASVRFPPGAPHTPADLSDEPVLALLVASDGGLTATALLPTDDGWFESATAPAGAGRIHYRTPETEESPPFAWPSAAELTIRAGERTTLE